ncbi:T-cell-specific guanine nucleotide triphosphate-binding protein 2-like [Mytilus californianus]|uniref:T-cell-specific guanine nucleotide triphosphate-binding protein 2-like n=1 Tax=Mytilus californianus TaxID=6549 RepID=UPI0022477B7D|nr:T-cell-specific guanine nucleotide triphosphate-binding protein 2-like [Mytilus californianus]
MGQKQSTVVSDNPEVQKIYEIAKSEGPAALQRYLDVTLNKWKTESVKFGIIGKTNVGKSTFINSIRGVTVGNKGYAAVGRGNTTQSPTSYYHPENDNIEFVDLPGVGTTKFPKQTYIGNMKVSEYDYFFIFFDTVLCEDDIWIASQLLKLGKSFSFVRSKIDKDVKHGLENNETEEEVLTRIREIFKSTLDENIELKTFAEIFLISSKTPSIGEMDKLNKHILDSLSSLNQEKFRVVVFSFGPMSEVVIDEKYKSLKKRAIAVTVGTSIISGIPLPFVDLAINIGIIVAEIRHYIKVFGLSEKQMELLQNFDYSQLKCKGLLFKKPTLQDITFIVRQQYTKFLATFALVALESVFDVLVPIVGSVISSATTAGIVHKFLNNYLDDLRHDAIIVYNHVTPKN